MRRSIVDDDEGEGKPLGSQLFKKMENDLTSRDPSVVELSIRDDILDHTSVIEQKH